MRTIEKRYVNAAGRPSLTALRDHLIDVAIRERALRPALIDVARVVARPRSRSTSAAPRSLPARRA